MNIAFINSTHKWGGVKTWILDFAQELSKKTHRIYIYGRQKEFINKSLKFGLDAQKVNFGIDFSPKTISFLIKEFKNKKIDIVILNVGKDLRTAGIAANILKIPIVQQIGLPGDIAYKLRIKLIHRWLNPYFLASCDYIKNGFLNRLPYVDKNRVKVIFTAKKPKKNLLLKTNHPRKLISTSQLNPDKGHSDIIRALSKIDIEFEYHIVGTGTIEDKLKYLTKMHNLESKIYFHGFQTNVDLFLENADIFILPSYSEGLPNTLQEAMNNGLLPISRNVGGISEVWPDKMQNLLLPYSAKANDFEHIIRWVLSLPDEQLINMKKIFLNTAHKKFDLTNKTLELERWLKTILHIYNKNIIS